MYTILIVFMLGISLFAANILILVPHLMAIVLILLRISKEEAMLIQEFGEVYREYILKTGRLLPKLKVSFKQNKSLNCTLSSLRIIASSWSY